LDPITVKILPANQGTGPDGKNQSRQLVLIVDFLDKTPTTPHPLNGSKKQIPMCSLQIFDMLAGASPASAMDGWAE